MEDIYKRLIKEGVSPNQLYILWCKRSNMVPLFNINLNVEYMRLITDGWLDEDKNLTSKSIQLVQELDSFFNTKKKKTSNDILGENFTCRIEEYLEIFPKFKLPSGKYARSDKKNLENNFRWFFETHSYTWETIINATKMYVDEYERQGYKYMRTSQYFVRKQNPIEKTFESELANYCEIFLNGTDDYGYDSHFKEKVV